MLHGRHIYVKASDIAQATMCTYPQSDHELTHWKFLLRLCAKFPCINIPDQEIDHHYSDTTTSIRLHIYHIIGRCTSCGRIPLNVKKYVTCVNKNLHLITLQKYTREKS